MKRHDGPNDDRTFVIIVLSNLAVSLVGAALEVFFEDVRVAFWFLTVTAVIALLLALYYVLTKEVTIGGELTDKPLTRKKYGLGVRSVSVLVLILIPVIILLGVKFAGGSHPKDEHLVFLTTKIDGPSPERYRISEILVDKLRNELSKYEESELVAINTHVPFTEGKTKAQELADKYNADIIVWGYYGVSDQSVLVSLNFELSDSFDKSVRSFLPYESVSTGYDAVHARKALESFRLQFTLAGGTNMFARFCRALVAYSEKDFNIASKLFEAINDMASDAPTFLGREIILYFQGDMYLQMDNFDKAIHSFSSAIEIDTTFAEAYALRSLAYLNAAKLDSSELDSKKALSLQPNDVVPLTNLGILAEMRGRTAEALDYLDRAIKQDPDGVAAKINRGNILLRLGKLEEALNQYNDILEKEPRNAQALLSKAEYYFRKGMFEEAINELTRAIRANPNDYVPYARRGFFRLIKAMIDSDTDLIEPALADLDKSVGLAPSNSYTYFHRGLAKELLGQVVAAQLDMEKATELTPPMIPAFIRLAMMHLDRGDYDAAISEMNDLIGYIPPEPQSYFVRGMLRGVQGDSSMALADLDTVMLYAQKPELSPLDSSQASFLINRSIRVSEKITRGVRLTESDFREEMDRFSNRVVGGELQKYPNLSVLN